MISRVHDNGGRRSGIEKRTILYFAHIPEQRKGQDRRSGVDRRQSDKDLLHANERRKRFK